MTPGTKSVTSSTHRITEYPELEGTLRDQRVQLLALRSTTQKSNPASELQQPWCCVHRGPRDPVPVPRITERTRTIVLYFTLDFKAEVALTTDIKAKNCVQIYLTIAAFTLLQQNYFIIHGKLESLTI